MPQNIAVDDVVQISICGTMQGYPFNTVRQYIASVVADGANAIAGLTGKFETSVIQVIVTRLSVDYIAQALYVTRLWPTPINAHYGALAAPLAGVINDDSIPNTSALIVRLLTAETGPRNRGRVYQPGIPENDCECGLLKATASAAVQAAMDAYAAVLVDAYANTWTPVVFSRTTRKAYLDALPPGDPDIQPVTAFTSPITSALIQGNLGSQRDRRVPVNIFG